ncbi:hypothetical protein AGLY_008931 [Aphis glycines]|uniref:Uncharacterized protein n=1 Tax=Aphis glycines TaxID=307491 RepID=A0A6G0TLC5_APHGL|nr:hypothetical protein AGLY_008931 [Aphis glycines]
MSFCRLVGVYYFHLHRSSTAASRVRVTPRKHNVVLTDCHATYTYVVTSVSRLFSVPFLLFTYLLNRLYLSVTRHDITAPSFVVVSRSLESHCHPKHYLPNVYYSIFCCITDVQDSAVVVVPTYVRRLRRTIRLAYRSREYYADTDPQFTAVASSTVGDGNARFSRRRKVVSPAYLDAVRLRVCTHRLPVSHRVRRTCLPTPQVCSNTTHIKWFFDTMVRSRGGAVAAVVESTVVRRSLPLTLAPAVPPPPAPLAPTPDRCRRPFNSCGGNNHDTRFGGGRRSRRPPPRCPISRHPT